MMKINKQLIIPTSLALCLVSAPATVNGEQILIPVGAQGGELHNISMPTTGEQQQSVRARYGEPESISGPHGEPPITRWNYVNFSVYFEYSSVIHSVLKHQRQQIPEKQPDN